MSFRTWMYVFAIGVAAFLGSWLSWSGFSTYQQNQANERDNSTSYYGEASKEGVNTCNAIMDESGFAAWLVCFAENPRPNNEVNQAEHDLKAQQDMAAWALGMLIVTAWLTGITFGGVIFVWRTFEATRKMANDTRDIGNRQTRSYVHCKSVKWEGRNEAQIVFDIENVGQSPATNVSIDYSMTYFSDGEDITDGGIPQGGYNKIGTIFPKSIIPTKCREFTLGSNISRNKTGIRVKGCVNYFDPVTKTQDKSVFLFIAHKVGHDAEFNLHCDD